MEGINNQGTIPLSDVRAGQGGRIVALERDDEHMNRLTELGLIAGETVHVVKYAPLGDPIEVKILNYNLCIRKQEAKSVRVLLEEGGLE